VTLDGIETFDAAMRCALISARTRRCCGDGQQPAAVEPAPAGGRALLPAAPRASAGEPHAGSARLSAAPPAAPFSPAASEDGDDLAGGDRGGGGGSGGGVDGGTTRVLVNGGGAAAARAGGGSCNGGAGSRGLHGLWARGERWWQEMVFRCFVPSA